MSKRSSVFVAVIALLSMTSCKGDTSAGDSVTSAPLSERTSMVDSSVSEKVSETSAKTLPDFTATIAGHKYDKTPIVTPYSGEKVTGSYTCTSDGTVTERWYKGKEELREAPKDIGDYTYYLAVDETATYQSASIEFPFTISALMLNFTDAFTKTYDGSDQMAIVLTDKNSNIIQDDDVTMNITFVSALPGSDIAQVTLAGDDKDNYALPDTVHASIVKANVATKPWDYEDTTWITYDGEPHSLKVEESPYYTVSGNLATEPGDYLVTATLNPGYAWSDGTTDPVKHHMAIREEYEATMRTTVESYQTEFEEDQTDCMILISGTEFGKIYKGMQVTLIDDYGKVLGTATVAEMANAETEEAVTEVGKDHETMILLDGIHPSVIAKNTTTTYLISLTTYTWEPKIIKEPTTSSEGAAAFIPKEEPNVKIPVVLPKLSADDYDIIRKTDPTCASTGVDVYDLKHDPADLAVYNTGSSLHKEEYVLALQNLCEFEVEVPENPENHTGKSHYEWSKAAGSMPTYDILTNKQSTGKADQYCDGCNHIIASEDVKYTDGMWRRNKSGTYDRVYKKGALKVDTGKDRWDVHVDTTDVKTGKGAAIDAHCSVTAQNSIFKIYISQFEKTGYTFDSITYYVDGAPQGKITKSYTKANSRVYYLAGATDPQFIIRIGKHENTDLGLNNNFTGDVYVKINWKKDA